MYEQSHHQKQSNQAKTHEHRRDGMGWDGMGWDGMDAHAPDIVVIMRTRHGVVVGAGAPRCYGDGGESGAGRGRRVAVAGHRDAARRRAMAACRCPSSTRCTSILMRDRNTLARTCGPCSDRYAGCCAGGGSWRIHRGAPAPPPTGCNLHWKLCL